MTDEIMTLRSLVEKAPTLIRCGIGADVPRLAREEGELPRRDFQVADRLPGRSAARGTNGLGHLAVRVAPGLGHRAEWILLRIRRIHDPTNCTGPDQQKYRASRIERSEAP